ncbi:MAG: hypothetical protein KKA97_06525, partial [Actinobacteria bacterium]|nr:hypothetical protein [Actinomycetota bacterium]
MKRAARRAVAPVASFAAVTTIASVSGFAITAATAPVAAAAPLPAFQASSASGLLDLQLLDLAGVFTAGDLSLDDAVGTTDLASDPRSIATATNLDGTLLTAIPLDGILSTTQQTAPPDNPDGAAEDVIPATSTPILDIGASNATASARWAGDDTCLPGDVPLTRSKITTADADVLPIPIAADTALVGLDDEVSVTQTTSLVETPSATTRSVEA